MTHFRRFLYGFTGMWVFFLTILLSDFLGDWHLDNDYNWTLGFIFAIIVGLLILGLGALDDLNCKVAYDEWAEELWDDPVEPKVPPGWAYVTKSGKILSVEDIERLAESEG